jgi:hypothetical protein
MASHNQYGWISIQFATVLTAACFCAGSARADIISSTPTLPLLGVPYVASSSAGCFPAANLCVSGGSITLTAPVTDLFNPLGEDILTGAVFSGTLTNLTNVPIGPVTLTGTVDQEIIGRTFDTETGSWTADLVGVTLTGPVGGHTLTLDLDSSQTSSGTTSITPIGGAGFAINSFFDVFVDLTLDTPTPLHATVGPIQLTATPAPEPTGLALLGLPILALLRARGTTRAA